MTYIAPRVRSRDEPERDELRVESEALSLRIGNAGEVLETNEGDAPAVGHELAGIRCADPDH